MSERQLISDLLSALEYHTEQTRPIEFSKVAIEAAREYLRKPEQPAQQPLTDEQIETYRLSLQYGSEEFLPDPWDFKQGVRAAEAAHGITGEKK